jgi:hypothetical protein
MDDPAMSGCKFIGAVFVIALCVYISANGQSVRPMLGMLEDTPGDVQSEPHHRDVRVLFYGDHGEWKAFPNDCRNVKCLTDVAAQYPQRVDWNVGFNGRQIGHLSTEAPKRFRSYHLVGQQRILTTSSIPSVGTAAVQFGGWSGAAVLRPLVANTRPFFSDPEAWLPADPPSEVLRRVREEFRKKHPSLVGCEHYNRPRRYADAEIRIVKAYTSRSGLRLIEVGVNRCAPNDESGDALEHEWYAAGLKGDVQYIGSNMWLVDTGDYDNDGKTELIFCVDDYNEGGYRLFYDNLKKQSAFTFSYH